MAVYVERDALGEQVQALAAESDQRGRALNLLLTFTETRESELGCLSTELQSVREAAYCAIQSPATDAILREVGAKAVEGAAGIFTPCSFESSAIHAALIVYAASIRAGEVPNV